MPPFESAKHTPIKEPVHGRSGDSKIGCHLRDRQ
jgi:hypothetical protein